MGHQLADYYTDDWETLVVVRADGGRRYCATAADGGAAETAGGPLLAVPQAPPAVPCCGDGQRWSGWTGAPGLIAPRGSDAGYAALDVRGAARARGAAAAVVFAAYHPALIFPDSVRYLHTHKFRDGAGAWTRWASVVLRPDPPGDAPAYLWLIRCVQHLPGSTRRACTRC